ncbi:FkbM family methyltransferase [Marivirga harenae]|uniref:FkbM family methyltransferase n=1 Tax=Marivirga harenae TaxID=2010992 RepID=UPI0026DFE8CB|nr:FkbM family methyltransferase [Marivirga harenae]WKV13568.1 FkbM family methyltransferase [Marivirga harenae]|tara:strand:+ start:208399 stop:209196 length:798 start_codon:yes stop_codon:yes gene_type:complete
MSSVKRIFKKNTHNRLFKALAGFGRALNRLYENRNHDLHSNGEYTILKKISKLNPAVIIDGGANIGKYSLVCKELMPNTLIYSLEPVKDTFKLLSQNVRAHTNMVPVQKGLYKTNTSKEINIFNSNTHSSLVDIQGLSYESTQKQTIELIKGDDFMRNQNINEVDLLKIDVEGAEFDALVGFDEHISNGKIRMIQFEYGYINITTKKLLIDFYNYFESKGYLLGKIFPKTVEFRKYEFKYEDFLGPNFIAVKKTETDLINLLKNR